jgi:hypothetical protein
MVAAALAGPSAVTAPAALVQNTILFPLGLTHVATPATSPLPGHLLAATGAAGHAVAIALLILAGVAVSGSLVARPPATPAAAAWRLAVGLTLMFALAPATRWGYFAYPAGLCAWSWLSGTSARGHASPDVSHHETCDAVHAAA